ncbi:MAG: Kelch repeat-containing protein [bacterium]
MISKQHVKRKRNRQARGPVVLYLLVSVLALVFVAPGGIIAQGGQWQEVFPNTTPAPRFGHTMVAIDGNVYFFGGLVKSTDIAGRSRMQPNPENDLWEYDDAVNDWSEVLPAGPPPGRHGHAAAVDQDGKMVIHGGKDALGQPKSDLWEFNTEVNNWSEVFAQGSARPARANHSMVATADGKIVAMGGMNNVGQPLADVYIYDTVASSWTKGADFPGGLGEGYGASAATVGNEMKVMGTSNNVYSYDLTTDSGQSRRYR